MKSMTCSTLPVLWRVPHLIACSERQLNGTQFSTASVRSWPIGDLQLKGPSPGFPTSMRENNSRALTTAVGRGTYGGQVLTRTPYQGIPSCPKIHENSHAVPPWNSSCHTA